MRLFDRLEIETMSACNRRCPTCLRNSHPQGARPWQLLPFDVALDILQQAKALGFAGTVFLSWHNEPLMDGRIDLFAAEAHKLGFAEVALCSNGDYLTPWLAAQLDGHLDTLRLALYDRPERGPEMRSWFQRTRVTLTGGRHIPRHFAPGAPVFPDHPCEMESQLRCAIAADGTMRQCCEDIAGTFGLGSVYERTLADLWYGEPHRGIVERLQRAGGRTGYCATCPQPNVPYWSARAQLLTSGD